MAILIDRFDGEVDFFSARDLRDYEFQTFDNMIVERRTRAIRNLAPDSVTSITGGYVLPGQGIFQYRAEWDDSVTPRQVSTTYRVAAVIVTTAGSEEINIKRSNAKNDPASTFGTEFIDETSAKGGWERATSNRLVNGSSNVSFTASTDRISGVANLENFEVGEVIRVINTTNNNGYFTVKSKAPAASSVDVQESLTDESNTSARIYPIPIISYYAVNGALRISNGNFYDDHASQWYGHIKRDFWGTGVTYGSNSGRYSQPPMKEAYNNWKLQAQELVAPTIYAGSRLGSSTSGANEIAIHKARSHHEFKELMPNSIDRTFTGGGTAWANVDLNAFNETTDLTITATVAAQYCTCPVASAPMTAARKYKLKFDVANLISTWTIQDFTGVQKFGSVSANGKKQSIKFTVDTAITGGLRIVADTDDASADFDNWSLSSIDWPEKAIDVEWNARDRVTATFVYDFVQESALGKSSSGEIGIPMGTVFNDEIARAFMVEVYTGAAQASWNRRITAIRLYYKFHDDPDWYEVVTLNVEKGWSESELIFDSENTGYWCPILASITDTGTTDAAGGSGTTVESDAHGLSAPDLLYIGSSAVIEPDSMCSIVASVVADTITLPVAAVNSLGVSTTYDAQPWCAGTISTTAVATFYIPFTGEKAFSYFTNTGRAAKLKVPATRWRAADTDGSKTLIGNIDTKDENDQTIRERTRVIETPDGMPDTFLLSKSKDVGVYSGDEIRTIKYFNGSWWIMMERTTVVLQPRTLKTLAHYNGVGCAWDNAAIATPFGLCVADKSAITLLPANKELTEKKRDTYATKYVRGLTVSTLNFYEPAMGYSSISKTLIFMPNTDGSEEDVWIYSFDSDSLTKYDLVDRSGWTNMIRLSQYNEPEIGLDDGTTLTILRLNASTGGNTRTSTILSKEFDLGHSNKQKTLRNGFLVYKASAVSYVKIYLDGSTTAYKSVEIAISTNWATVEVPLNVTAKTFTFGFESAGNTYEIDEFKIPDEEITVHD